jgi:UDP-N-acetylmuramyl pentapeptide phosphotransferase/UDP-N-acetylglucosamine-1-phosphate transferase
MTTQSIPALTLLAHQITPLASKAMMSADFVLSMILTWATSVGVCFLILATTRFHQHTTTDHQVGVQKVHQGQVPRIGGLALALALPVAFHDWFGSSQHPLLTLLSLSVLPAFAFGLIEDCTGKVAVIFRLWATIFSGVLGCVLLDVSIRTIGIDWINGYLAIPLVSIAFTAFASAGLASSINLIDGLHGLSTTVSMAILSAIGVLAYQQNDGTLTQIVILINLAILGFWLFNWPWGKLFLGDGGAYLIGFLIAWMAILLSSRNPAISAFAPLLICAYPIIETLFSIARRIHFKKRMGQPDQRHLHHLVLFLVKYRLNVSQRWANALAGILTSLVCLPPIFLALNTPSDRDSLMTSFGLMILGYWALYGFLQSQSKVIAKTSSYGDHQVFKH